MIKLSIYQREFQRIPEDITPSSFLKADAISFENIPVHTLPVFLFEMRDLRELVLKNTDLRMESIGNLPSLENLERLDLSDNPNFFKDGFITKSNCYTTGVIFKERRCYNTDVYNGSSLGGIIFNLAKLETLIVSNIGTYPNNVWASKNDLSAKVNLSTLRAEQSNFDFSKTSAFAHMDIKYLDISGSSLSGSSVNKMCSAFKVHVVKELDISDTRLPVLKFCNFDNLEKLDISGNPISKVDGRYLSIFAVPKLLSLRFDLGQKPVRDFTCKKLPKQDVCRDMNSTQIDDNLKVPLGINVKKGGSGLIITSVIESSKALIAVGRLCLKITTLPLIATSLLTS